MAEDPAGDDMTTPVDAPEMESLTQGPINRNAPFHRERSFYLRQESARKALNRAPNPAQGSPELRTSGGSRSRGARRGVAAARG